MSKFAVTNANTGKVEKEFPSVTKDEIPGYIDRAHEAFLSWRETSLTERGRVLRAFGELVDERAEAMADVIGREMGKPKAQGVAEAQKVARTARWFADHAHMYLEPTQLPAAGAERSYVRHDPLGVLLGIMPWNFPYNQIARFVLPNLMVGNAILMKQASICPESSQLFADMLEEAGLPKGVYQNLYLNSSDAEEVLKDFRVKGFSLTGSEGAGASVAGIAAKYLKRSVLELGGNDPFVVLDSADVPALAKQAVQLRLSNAGQVCTSPKRMIVVEDLYDEFVAEAVKAVEATKVSDYDDPDVGMGPMSSEDARDETVERIQQAVADGATLHTGGEKLDRNGWFMSPAVLTDIDPQSDLGCNELFGPAVMIYKAKDADDALRLANDTDYGLMSSVWTDDPEKGAEFAAKINAGMSFVNSHMESSPEFPFGGINRSGYGRENAQWALREFTNEHLIREHAAK
ncbi:aldehyde dehydrogenase family protein [Brevibacterium sp. 5221]|uniref:Aldehyde dehydrogenase family protein n=1 Tax=Brevibacterium rongguiense TaxID=2695267 RepID=A0A6N9H9B0_9MICO|nr:MULTISPECIES: NAD-dependent succinate-semialdehyde dehydrogenase [Brevibacterium]MYM20627.1 aldehyde dehydrogenase family protein [Brevibacterium rongguiense]WAL40251.1 NAD-dependent succinate-semialdehyde dehydrogenase [Brevibacterium sp. BRM-1]